MAGGDEVAWSAFLAMRIPDVTHNDLEPYRRRGKGLGIRKSDRLKDAEDAIMARIRAAGVPDAPMAGALRLTARWCYEPDSAHQLGSPKTTKPDTSNMLKTLEDCLTRCGVIADDSIICAHSLSKGYSRPEGIYVEIRHIG